MRPGSDRGESRVIRLISSQSGSVWSNSSHTVSSSSIARYRPALGDTNKTISCTVKQEEEGRLVLGQIVDQRMLLY